MEKEKPKAQIKIFENPIIQTVILATDANNRAAIWAFLLEKDKWLVIHDLMAKNYMNKETGKFETAKTAEERNAHCFESWQDAEVAFKKFYLPND